MDGSHEVTIRISDDGVAQCLSNELLPHAPRRPTWAAHEPGARLSHPAVRRCFRCVSTSRCDQIELRVGGARPGSDGEGPGGSVVVAPVRAAELEQLFHAEYARVVAIARRVLGDENAAEDTAQEVFLAFARSEVSPAAARGWLAAAAAHTALNVARSERRRIGREWRVHFDPAFAQTGAVHDPAEQVLRGQDRARVRAALMTLPRAQAVALVLRHSGASYIEVADAVGLSATGIGTLLRRAEAALRKELIDDAPCP